MSRPLSLTARQNLDASSSDEAWVVLLEFDHKDLEAPLRFSTDPTERISTEPLIYGSRSTWRGADPISDYWQFIAASLEMPSDQEDVPAAVTLTFDLFDARVPTLLRSFTTRATANIAIFTSADLNAPEQQFLGLQVMKGNYGTKIKISSSRQPIEEEGAPMDIIGKQRFPGLFR
jgi:hypothetical protein